jgi:hypothetical protein
MLFQDHWYWKWWVWCLLCQSNMIDCGSIEGLIWSLGQQARWGTQICAVIQHPTLEVTKETTIVTVITTKKEKVLLLPNCPICSPSLRRMALFQSVELHLYQTFGVRAEGTNTTTKSLSLKLFHSANVTEAFGVFKYIFRYLIYLLLYTFQVHYTSIFQTMVL